MLVKDELNELQQLIESNTYRRPEPIDAVSRQDEKNKFQLDLLKETISYTYNNVPYYKNIWDNIGLVPTNLCSLDDYRQWPILKKQDVFENRDSILSRSCNVIGYRCTTGTTGKRLPLPISREEVQAINQFSKLRGLASTRKTGHAPIVLQVAPPVRRIATNTGGSGGGPVIVTYMNLDAADHRFEFDYVDHIMQCLLEEYPSNTASNRVEVLWTCPTFMVRTLTDLLMRRNFDIDSCVVKNIVCSGGTITKALCQHINDFWGVPLSGYYSMTEVAGSHKRNPTTGEYVFDPMTFVEFVDPNTYERVTDGQDGVLVLTSLYPFQQAQPMIRYWTGDVFTVRNHGQAGIFRGRLHECADLSILENIRTYPCMLGSADILEVLHGIPELPQNHKNPKFKLMTNPGKSIPLSLVVESYPQGNSVRRCLEERISEKLSECITLRNDTQLDKAIVEVKLVDKGSLLDTGAHYYPDR